MNYKKANLRKQKFALCVYNQNMLSELDHIEVGLFSEVALIDQNI